MEISIADITKKIVCNDYIGIALLEIENKQLTVFQCEQGALKACPPCTYHAYVQEFSQSVIEEQRAAFQSKLKFDEVLDALAHHTETLNQRYQVFGADGILYHRNLTITYYDDKKTHLLLSIYDETKQLEDQFKLIDCLRRTEKRFNFLIKHICIDFVEVDIKTGESCITQSRSNKFRKGIWSEQVEYFAEHYIIKEERECYKKDFELSNLLKTLKEKEDSHSATYTAFLDDGKHFLLITYALVKDMDKDYIFLYTQDITEIKRHEEQNRRLIDISQQLLSISQQDAMTGLLNRAAAEKLIEEHLMQEMHGEIGTLLLIDIDCFKRVNDEWGHTIGDHVLCYLAKSMREVFRSEDILCRWGGDEFLIFMKNVNDEMTVESRIERLRYRMSQCEEVEDVFPITLSVGGVIANIWSDLENLFKNADKILYDVKRSGRNGYILKLLDSFDT